MEQTDEPHCLACGQPLPPLLSQTGSVRCHDCRDEQAPVRAELVDADAPATRAA